MNKRKRTYRIAQLQGVSPQCGQYNHSLKIKASDGETEWLGISTSELRVIKKVLIDPDYYLPLLDN